GRWGRARDDESQDRRRPHPHRQASKSRRRSFERLREVHSPPVTIAARPNVADQVEGANASGLTPVVFIHGLWLLSSSWDRWATLFEQAGYAPVQPGWPDDPNTVAEANARPEVFAGKTVGQVG